MIKYQINIKNEKCRKCTKQRSGRQCQCSVCLLNDVCDKALDLDCAMCLDCAEQKKSMVYIKSMRSLSELVQWKNKHIEDVWSRIVGNDTPKQGDGTLVIKEGRNNEAYQFIYKDEVRAKALYEVKGHEMRFILEMM